MQGFVLHCALPDILNMIDVVRAVEPSFITNAQRNQRDFTLCDRYANWMQIAVKITSASYVSGGVIITIYFTVTNYLSGNGRPCIFLFLIGVDEYSTGLMILLQAYNFTLLLLVFMYVVPVDILSILAVMSVRFLSHRFEAEISELNRDLVGGNLTPLEMKQRLKEIILMHQRYVE